MATIHVATGLTAFPRTSRTWITTMRTAAISTAQQGLHRGLTGRYADAAIVDRGLPVMDGVELVEVLRSRESRHRYWC